MARYHVSHADPSEWDGLVQRFPDRTVFHGLAWLRSVERAHGLRMVLVKAESSEGVVAVWPCLQQRKGPFRILGSPLPGWSTVYLGPLFASNVDVSVVLEAFLADRVFCRSAYCYCKVLDISHPVDLSPFGFERLHRYRTYLLPLTQSEEELWSNLKSECRTRVRKARKSGLVVRLEEDGSFLRDFWMMSVRVFAKSNMSPSYTQRFLNTMWENLHATGRVCVLSAFLEEKRIGTLVLPHDERSMYYWAGASDYEYSKLAPNNLLQWEAICQARRLGLRQYDFVSVYGGPGRFKKSFGGTETATATHWERSRNKLVGWLKKVYERRLRAKQRVRHG